jgi:hypothetical protein
MNIILQRISFKTKRLAHRCFMNTGLVAPFSDLKLAGRSVGCCSAAVAAAAS